MTREINNTQRMAVNNVLSFFVGKTLATLATESGLPLSVVRRIVNAGVERGTLERKGNRYRIDNTAPWVEREPPPIRAGSNLAPPMSPPSPSPSPSPPPTRKRAPKKVRDEIAALLAGSETE